MARPKAAHDEWPRQSRLYLVNLGMADKKGLIE